MDGRRIDRVLISQIPQDRSGKRRIDRKAPEVQGR